MVLSQVVAHRDYSFIQYYIILSSLDTDFSIDLNIIVCSISTVDAIIWG